MEPNSNDLDTAYGQCFSYYDCDGNYQVFYKEGSAKGYGAALTTATTTVESGGNAKPFYWEFDDYPVPTLSDCDACDPDPDNHENPVSTNAPEASITFYFSYECTVTP